MTDLKVLFRSWAFYLPIIQVLFYFFTVNILPGLALAVISGGIGLFLLLFKRENPHILYFIFLTSGLFYYAFQGDMILNSFNMSQVAGKLALSANILGVLSLLGTFLIPGYGINKIKFKNIDFYLILFVIVLSFTSLIAENTVVSLDNLMRLPSFILVYLMSRSYLKSKDHFKLYISYTFSVILIIFAFAGLKLIGGGEYNTIGDFMYFLPIVSVVAFYQYNKYKSRKSAILLILIFLGSLLLLVTQSRRVLIGVIMNWGFILYYFRINVRTVVPIFVVLILIASMGFFTQFIRYNKTFDILKNAYTQGELEQEQAKSISSGRTELWAAGLNLVLDNPYFGVGWGNNVNQIKYYGTDKTARVHNIFLDIPAQMGIGGLIIFILLLISIIRQYNHTAHILRKRRNNEEYYLSRAFMLGIVITIALSFFGGSVLFEKWGWFKFGSTAAALVYFQNFMASNHKPLERRD